MSGWRVIGAAGVLAALSAFTTARAQELKPEPTVEALQDLSIEDLANLPVTTVSRRQESLARAPAATYVITRDEIIRSGARSLPDVLRLAPNLFVAQTGASSWVITARGLAGNLADQAFSNKLLVLVDGRSVYTPLFSGVYWDLQDVSVSDIDHVEVISGPAGALWGANAVNGVINVITRRAQDTQGAGLMIDAGDQERVLEARVGGKLGERASWRAFARGYQAERTLTSAGDEAMDSWGRGMLGFRFDWAPGDRDQVTVHGDAFRGSGESIGSIGGGALYARWNHQAANGHALQVQAYASREQRGRDLTGGVPLWVNTYDIDVQDGFILGAHDIVVGGGLRRSDYSIAFSPSLQFSPTKGSLDLASLFAQDTISLRSDLRLVLGLKAENDPYVGWSALPNVRLAWTPNDGALVWAAASGAIRSPTPFDRDVREVVGGMLFLTGDPQYGTEKLTAYELGARLQPNSRYSFSVSAYYNRYDDLRSIELAPGGFLPLRWSQFIEGHTQGVEVWGDLQVAGWWRLSASANLMREDFRFKPGASRILGVAQVGDDPKVQAMLKSSMRLGPSVTWDAVLRHQGELPDPQVPAYTELDSRLAWNLTDRLQAAVIGRNLLHESHLEFQAPQANRVPRSVMAELRWRF